MLTTLKTRTHETSGFLAQIATVRCAPVWLIGLAIAVHIILGMLYWYAFGRSAWMTAIYCAFGAVWWTWGRFSNGEEDDRRSPWPNILLITLAIWTLIAFCTQWWIFPAIAGRVDLAPIIVLFELVNQYGPQLLAIGLLWLCVGRLHARDLGLDSGKLLQAICWTLAIWLAAQIAFVMSRMGDVHIAHAWSTKPLLVLEDLILGQVLGNALYEELFFRSFLLVQLIIWFRNRSHGAPPKVLAWAVLAATLIFALTHIPGDIARGSSGAQVLLDQIPRLVMGLIFAGIFLMTNNILLVVGIHAIFNKPTSPFHLGSTGIEQGVIALLPLTLLVVIPQIRTTLTRRKKHDQLPNS